MQSWIELSRSSLLHNYKTFVNLLGGSSHVMLVLKSNAYGHGLEKSYEILKEANPVWLGVNYVSEAKMLRSLGFKGRILNLGPAFEEDLQDCVSKDIEVILDNRPLLEAWKALHPRPKAHLKVDTGLARRGFLLQDFCELLPGLNSFREDLVGLATHFANVEDVTRTEYADFQLRNFKQASEACQSEGFTKLLTHSASSASALLISKARFDLNRIGISLYGFWPSELTHLSFHALGHPQVELRPVLSWKARLQSTRMIKEGDLVGYGCTFRASRKMKIGVVPVGYYEGYTRSAATQGAYVLVQGKRCPLVGRICMNLMMVDLENAKEAERGELVTLLGRDHGDQVSAEQLAIWSGTIHYEVVTRLHPMLPRKIVD